jgi:hypothetical protein
VLCLCRLRTKPCTTCSHLKAILTLTWAHYISLSNTGERALQLFFFWRLIFAVFLHCFEGAFELLICLPDRYVPSDMSDTSVSLTLEYSFDNWAVGSLARALNKSEWQMFANRSMNYKNVWDHESQYFCARSSNGVSRTSIPRHNTNAARLMCQCLQCL